MSVQPDAQYVDRVDTNRFIEQTIVHSPIVLFHYPNFRVRCFKDKNVNKITGKIGSALTDMQPKTHLNASTTLSTNTEFSPYSTAMNILDWKSFNFNTIEDEDSVPFDDSDSELNELETKMKADSATDEDNSTLYTDIDVSVSITSTSITFGVSKEISFDSPVQSSAMLTGKQDQDYLFVLLKDNTLLLIKGIFLNDAIEPAVIQRKLLFEESGHKREIQLLDNAITTSKNGFLTVSTLNKIIKLYKISYSTQNIPYLSNCLNLFVDGDLVLFTSFFDFDSSECETSYILSLTSSLSGLYRLELFDLKNNINGKVQGNNYIRKAYSFLLDNSFETPYFMVPSEKTKGCIFISEDKCVFIGISFINSHEGVDYAEITFPLRKSESKFNPISYYKPTEFIDSLYCEEYDDNNYIIDQILISNAYPSLWLLEVLYNKQKLTWSLNLRKLFTQQTIYNKFTFEKIDKGESSDTYYLWCSNQHGHNSTKTVQLTPKSDSNGFILEVLNDFKTENRYLPLLCAAKVKIQPTKLTSPTYINEIWFGARLEDKGILYNVRSGYEAEKFKINDNDQFNSKSDPVQSIQSFRFNRLRFALLNYLQHSNIIYISDSPNTKSDGIDIEMESEEFKDDDDSDSVDDEDYEHGSNKFLSCTEIEELRQDSTTVHFQFNQLTGMFLQVLPNRILYVDINNLENKTEIEFSQQILFATSVGNKVVISYLDNGENKHQVKTTVLMLNTKNSFRGWQVPPSPIDFSKFYDTDTLNVKEKISTLRSKVSHLMSSKSPTDFLESLTPDLLLCTQTYFEEEFEELKICLPSGVSFEEKYGEKFKSMLEMAKTNNAEHIPRTSQISMLKFVTLSTGEYLCIGEYTNRICFYQYSEMTDTFECVKILQFETDDGFAVPHDISELSETSSLGQFIVTSMNGSYKFVSIQNKNMTCGFEAGAIKVDDFPLRITPKKSSPNEFFLCGKSIWKLDTSISRYPKKIYVSETTDRSTYSIDLVDDTVDEDDDKTIDSTDASFMENINNKLFRWDRLLSVRDDGIIQLYVPNKPVNNTRRINIFKTPLKLLPVENLNIIAVIPKVNQEKSKKISDYIIFADLSTKKLLSINYQDIKRDLPFGVSEKPLCISEWNPEYGDESDRQKLRKNKTIHKYSYILVGCVKKGSVMIYNGNQPTEENFSTEIEEGGNNEEIIRNNGSGFIQGDIGTVKVFEISKHKNEITMKLAASWVVSDGPVFSVNQLSDGSIIYSSGCSLYHKTFKVEESIKKGCQFSQGTVVKKYISNITGINVLVKPPSRELVQFNPDVFDQCKITIVTERDPAEWIEYSKGRFFVGKNGKDTVNRSALCDALYFNEHSIIVSDKSQCTLSKIDHQNSFSFFTTSPYKLSYIPRILLCDARPIWNFRKSKRRKGNGDGRYGQRQRMSNSEDTENGKQDNNDAELFIYDAHEYDKFESEFIPQDDDIMFSSYRFRNQFISYGLNGEIRLYTEAEGVEIERLQYACSRISAIRNIIIAHKNQGLRGELNGEVIKSHSMFDTGHEIDITSLDDGAIDILGSKIMFPHESNCNEFNRKYRQPPLSQVKTSSSYLSSGEKSNDTNLQNSFIFNVDYLKEIGVPYHAMDDLLNYGGF
ncbi:hypothetical protein BVG19_g152 [[Candida] boidinii]|nr:hypothetical protein BVG19_g152 [[Candida] boidinii]OWB49720.1 hypothetical protein B5S27_g1262 [[Candida] boidinii]